MDEQITQPEAPAAEAAMSRIPWENRRGWNNIVPFWRTVAYVIRRGGKLGEAELAGITPRNAKQFRGMVVAHAMLAAFTVGVCGAARLGDQANIGVLLIVLTIMLVLQWLLVRFAIGTSRWFFAPRSMSREQQERLLAVCNYLSAPLVLTLLTIPGAVAAVAPSSTLTLTFRISSLAGVAAWLCWLVVLVMGMRSITGRSWKNAFLSGVGLLVIWAVLAMSLFLLLPASFVAWFLIWATTT